MKQTAVEWYNLKVIELMTQREQKNIDVLEFRNQLDLLLIQAKEMERYQKHDSIEKQVSILKSTLEEMMTGFDSEEDKIDFILDICNGYNKRINL